MNLNGLGYLISTISVGLLGIVAWPKPDEPRWMVGVILLGMATSVIGMFIRFLSHRKDRNDIDHAERKADGH
jgi:hypothetical protein